MRCANLVVAALLFVVVPSRVFAGGPEITTGGTRGIARGGAVAVAPQDPMALLYNPSALSDLAGNQFLVNVDAIFHDVCVDPYGYYGWGIYEGGRSEFSDTSPDAADLQVNRDYLNDPLDRVCNSGPVAPVPQIVLSFKLNEQLGLAVGFANNVGLGDTQWGGADGTIQTAHGPRPTPTRYQLISTKTTPVMALSVGAGYRALPWLSFGMTLQWLGAEAQSSAVQAASAGTSPHEDMFVRIKAKDYFVPTATLAVTARPMPNLEVMLAFHWADSFNGSGEATYTTNHYQYGATTGSVSRTNKPLALTEISNNLPWSLTLGARYADLIKPREELHPDAEHPGDSLENERWDVEMNVVWNMLSRGSSSRLGVKDTCVYDNGNRVLVRGGDGASLGYHEGCQLLEFQSVGPDNMSRITSFDVPPDNGINTFDLNRKWKDQAIIRIGGSYNPLPNRLGINAGAFYETRGINAAFANIDSMPFSRIGLSFGAVYRLGAWDLMIAYAHVFQETLIVAPPAHQNRQDAVEGNPTSGFDQRIGAACTADSPAADCDPVADPSVESGADATARLQQSSVLEQAGQVSRVVNAGKYTAGYDALSVGFNYRF